MSTRKLTHEEWLVEGREKFGTDAKAWRFVCPSCGHPQSISDMISAGMPESMFAFSCVGRALGSEKTLTEKSAGRGCNYAGGGLFKLNPVHVMMDDGSVRETFEWSSDAV